MSSNLRVNNILPSVGTNVAIGTAGGSITLTGTVSGSSNINVGTGASISSPSTNVLTLGTNNVESVRIDSSGNLGIGTNNPTKALHISQNSDVAIRMHSGNSNTNARSWEIVVGGNASNNAEMVFRTRNDAGTGGSEAARFTASGNLAFPSGQGIDFSATANSSGTMTSELLDDYEVGTWTPTIAATSSNPTISYTSGEREGSYVKIGKLVHVDFWIRITSCSAQGSGDLRISGLPFSEGSNAFRGQANFERFDFTGATAGSGEHILGEVDGTVIEMRRRANTGSVSVISTGSIPGSVSFAIGAATYTTS